MGPCKSSYICHNTHISEIFTCQYQTAQLNCLVSSVEGCGLSDRVYSLAKAGTSLLATTSRLPMYTNQPPIQGVQSNLSLCIKVWRMKLTTQSIAKVKNEWRFPTLYLTLSCLECSYTEATLCSPLLMGCDNSDNTVTSYRLNYWGSVPSTGRLFCFTNTYTNYSTHPTYYSGALSDLSLDIK
jgi:hypothetical protein